MTCSRECNIENRRRSARSAWAAGSPNRPPAHRERVTSRRIYPRECDICGRLYIGRSSNSRYCRSHTQNERDTFAVMERYRSDPAFRDWVISAAQNRRASLLGLPGITRPAHLITFLMERDGATCQIDRCVMPSRAVTDVTGPGMASIDHRLPLSRGGEHTIENVQLAHYACNLAKGSRVES